jgi:hypothetical protein
VAGSTTLTLASSEFSTKIGEDWDWAWAAKGAAAAKTRPQEATQRTNNFTAHHR